MPNELDNVRAQRKQHADDEKARLREFVKGYLTEDELQRRWDRLRGVGREGASPRFGWTNQLNEILVALTGSFRQRVVWVGLAAMMMFGLWLLVSESGKPTETLVCRADLRALGDKPPFSGRLVLELRLAKSPQTMTIVEGGNRYSGKLAPVTSTDPAQQLFDVTLSGKTSKGERMEFSGRLCLNLSGPASGIPKASQVKSARLEGDMKIAGQQGTAINKTFDRP